MSEKKKRKREMVKPDAKSETEKRGFASFSLWPVTKTARVK